MMQLDTEAGCPEIAASLGMVCEVCGQPATHAIGDVQMLPPDGNSWRRMKGHSTHWFCKAHKRPPIDYPCAEGQV